MQPDQKPPGNGRGRPRQENGPTTPTTSKIETSVTPAWPRRLGCNCGHLDGEPCEYDVPAVDRYRARLGVEAVGRINPGTCRCQRACWVGSREQGNARFICVCREGVMAS